MKEKQWDKQVTMPVARHCDFSYREIQEYMIDSFSTVYELTECEFTKHKPPAGSMAMIDGLMQYIDYVIMMKFTHEGGRNENTDSRASSPETAHI